MTGQNRSSSVMQQRRSDGAERSAGRIIAPTQLQYFPTPPWATRALCEFLAGQGLQLAELSAWEPACGELHMARPLAEFVDWVKVSDVYRYADGHELLDFVMFGGDEPPVDLVASNPPFPQAQAFIETALGVAKVAVAMLVRGAFLEGERRHASLWSKRPPTHVLQFAERVVMLENRLVQAGTVDPFAEKEGTKASTATAYVWLVWILADMAADPAQTDTRFRWIPPCRARLERPGDYPDYIAPAPLQADGLFGGQA